MKTPDDEIKKINQLSLLPEPPLKVTYPTKNSLHGRCLRRLLNGETITHVDEINETGSWRLAASINKLKSDYGWPISSYRRPVRTSETKRKSISHYFLPEKIIEQVLMFQKG